jgi:hypothetical protein
MDRVRAKFRCVSITRTMTGMEELQTINMTPVTGYGDPNHENSKFWKWTPSGRVELGCANPAAAGMFKLNEEYYLTFEPADRGTDLGS